MHQPSPVADLIDRWPSLGGFARDAGVSYGGAKQMRRRGSIAVGYWPALIASIRGREIGLSAEMLVQLHADRNPAENLDLASETL